MQNQIQLHWKGEDVGGVEERMWKAVVRAARREEMRMEKKNKDKHDKDPKDTQQKGPFLLTNLVRTGNQMGGASTWSILCKALDKLVSANLQLLPVSKMPVDAHDRLIWNQGIMKLLGKLPPEFDIEKFDSNPEQYLTGKKRFPAMLESAVELLRLEFRTWLLIDWLSGHSQESES